MHKFGVIPTVDEDALRNVRPALAQAWRSFIDYNPRNGILAVATQLGEVRSEERRVGKECRSRWSPYH